MATHDPVRGKSPAVISDKEEQAPNAAANQDAQALQENAQEVAEAGRPKEQSKEKIEPPAISKFMSTFITGIMIPIIVGIFVVGGLEATSAANDQSQIANQLAFLLLCSGNVSSQICRDLLAQTDQFLPTIANALYSGLPPTSGGGPPESTNNTTYSVSLIDSKFGSSTANGLVITFYISIGLIVGLYMSQFILVYKRPSLERLLVKARFKVKDPERGHGTSP